jgi:ABC-type phosphate/phosphonate transport system substrate-binding protein
VVVIFVSPDASGTEGTDDLSLAFTTDTGLYVDIQVTDSYAEALDALCDRRAAAVSLDAFSYLIASRDECGTAVQVVRQNGATATQGQLIATDVFRPEFFVGAFCRPDSQSLHGWVVPVLTLEARGMDPYTAMLVIDAGSEEEVIRRIDNGQCRMGATTLGAEANVSGLLNPQRLRMLEALTPVSNDVVVLSSQMDPSVQALLSDTVDAHSAEIAAVLGGDDLERTEDDAFNELRTLFSNAQVDPDALRQ